MEIGVPNVVPPNGEFTTEVHLEGMACVVVYQDFQRGTYPNGKLIVICNAAK
jgi:hypothetical protein